MGSIYAYFTIFESECVWNVDFFTFFLHICKKSSNFVPDFGNREIEDYKIVNKSYFVNR